MNGIQHGQAHNFEKPFPGCLGRMVDLFDLSTGVAGNQLLTDKPHRDGSPLSRSQSDAARMSPTGDQMDDKVIVSELRRRSSHKKFNGTPMKMLIAEEMSKEESNHNPPSVVAKLMGLDTLPQRQPGSAARRGHLRGSSWSHSGIPLSYWQQEDGFLDTEMEREIHQYPEQNEYKDVYEIWQQSQKTNYIRDTSPRKGRHKESINEKKMALIRQKFIEAKHLATDEKLRQSKQFQDALEVLSSNKDLFLKFLQEPNSLFSQHRYNMQSSPPSPDTKRITVLRPSKMVDNDKFAGPGKKNENQVKKAVHVHQTNGSGKGNPGFSPSAAGCWKVDENPIQPTRIVVLKPCPGKPHDIKTSVSPPSSSPRILQSEEFYGKPEDDVAQESREVAKKITQHMRENISRYRRDETLHSSVFSNGYIGDESSFTKSQKEYAADNFSDSDVMSPASRHSWDYISRLGSPYSSSFSRASHSPESSVCREAKKRLSERWTMMASNETYQEQRHMRRSSSTLGQMLALSDTNKSVRSEEEGSNKEREPRGSTSCLTTDLNKNEGADSSPRKLLRSKSVPVSSTVYGTRLNLEVSDPEVGKIDVPKELTKARSMKSSFKGKVSSLFFSRGKKSSKEKSCAYQSGNESQSAAMPVHSPAKIGDDGSQCASSDIGQEDSLSPVMHGSFSKASSAYLIKVESKQGVISCEDGLSLTKTLAYGNPSDTQDQPSPISVLEPPFEEVDHTAPESSGNFKLDRQGGESPVHALKSNLIDKSPPIGSIARTLSWDASCVDTATSYPLKPSLASQGAMEEEQEWFYFVQKLLSVAGLDGELQADSFLARWHSPESLLDPSLRERDVELNEKETIHESKRRQRRSTRKLVFDCVNAALVDIAGYGSDTCQRAISCSIDAESSIMVDLVWARMKEWFYSDGGCVSGDGGDSNSLVVETMARKEVVGKGWVENLRLERDNLGKEIEGQLLEELVQEAVVELN